MKHPIEIKAAIDRAAAMVTAKPAIGQRAYKSTASVRGGLICSVREKNWDLIADIPEAMGGENTAPSPSTLFRAAVSSCVAMGIKMWAARMDVPIELAEADFETDVDARGQFGVDDSVPAGFESARLSIHVVSNAAESDVRNVVSASLQYSPMMDVIVGQFPISTDIRVSAPDAALKGVAA